MKYLNLFSKKYKKVLAFDGGGVRAIMGIYFLKKLEEESERILEEAEQLVSNGVREITLLGQNVNAYSYDKNNKTYKLSDLILNLEKINDLKRIRYTTSHPRDMTDDLIEC